MAIIQRVEHFAKYVKKFIISRKLGNFGPVGVVLFIPVDIPQFEKWIPVLKSFPQFFEIKFGVAEHGWHKSHLGRFEEPNRTVGHCFSSRFQELRRNDVGLEAVQESHHFATLSRANTQLASNARHDLDETRPVRLSDPHALV